MKILQLSKFYPPAHGGIEAVARDLSRGFVRHGLDVEVLCAHTRLRHVDERDALGVRIVRAPSFGLVLSTSAAPTLPWVARRHAHVADIVHVHMPDPLAALAVWTARPRARVVVHWHSDVVRQRLSMALYRPLQDWLLRRADAIIATSTAYADSSLPLQAWRSKVEVIPLGAPAPVPPSDRAVAATRERYGGRRIVFALGRMTYYKGYEVLIEAARALTPDVVVVVGGGGDRLRHYQALAHDQGVGEKVRFVGPMSAARVEAHFAAAEVFCMASTLRAEAFGMSVVEAMARGLPVVTTDIEGSGIGWANQHGVTGLKVPPRDPQQLAAALQRLLADDTLRQRCGAAARARWEAHFAAETMADTTVALYQRLLGLPALPGLGGDPAAVADAGAAPLSAEPDSAAARPTPGPTPGTVPSPIPATLPTLAHTDTTD